MSGAGTERRQQRFRPRLLPVLIIACFFAAGAQIAEILRIDGGLLQAFGVESANAAEHRAAQANDASRSEEPDTSSATMLVSERRFDWRPVSSRISSRPAVMRRVNRPDT